MSVPPTSTSSTTQPPIPVGDTSKSVLLAAQAMTLPSVTSTSTSQYSAETLITILERPSTSLSQSVDVVMETPDQRWFYQENFRRWPRDHWFVYVTLWLSPFLYILRPLNLLVPRKHQFVLERNISHQFPASLHSPGPPVLSPQISFSQPTPFRIPETYMGHQQEHCPVP